MNPNTCPNPNQVLSQTKEPPIQTNLPRRKVQSKRQFFFMKAFDTACRWLSNDSYNS